MKRELDFKITHVSNGRPRNKKKEYIYRLVAEKALGKPLPKNAQVHHVDGNSANNDPRNLVICPDNSYHRLLHGRQSVVDRGNNPNTHRYCAYHKKDEPLESFGRDSSDSSGINQRCKEAEAERSRIRRNNKTGAFNERTT